MSLCHEIRPAGMTELITTIYGTREVPNGEFDRICDRYLHWCETAAA